MEDAGEILQFIQPPIPPQTILGSLYSLNLPPHRQTCQIHGLTVLPESRQRLFIKTIDPWS